MQINANSCFNGNNNILNSSLNMNGNNNVGNIEDSVVQISQGNENIIINNSTIEVSFSLTDKQLLLLSSVLPSLPKKGKKDFLIEKLT